MDNPAMSRPDRSPTGRPELLWVFHFLFMGTVLLYLLFGWLVVIAPNPDAAVRPASDFLFPVLVVITFVQTFLAFRIPEFMKAMAPMADDPPRLYIQKRQYQLIVMDALVEANGIYILVALLLRALKPWQFVALEGLTLLAFVAAAPRIQGWLAEWRSRRGGG